jgi:Protein of unknown function (DUF3987)
MVGQRVMDPQSVPGAVSAQYTMTVQTLARSLDALTTPLVVPLSPAASTTFLAFRKKLELRRGEAGDLAALSGWASKLDGATARIAGLLHLAQHLPDGFAKPIEETTMASAIAITSYFIPHALIAFERMGADERREGARAVLDWIRRDKLPSFTKRQTQRALQRHFPRVADLEPALALLEEHGFIRPAARPLREGRPSTTYVTCPRIPETR